MGAHPWLRCYRCWSTDLEVQVHYEGIHRIDPQTGERAEVVDELQEAVVQCLECMHDQPHLAFANGRVEAVEDRWERMIAGTPWVASCTVTVDADDVETCSGPEQVSTSSASTVTVHEATQGVPAIIRSQRSSIGSTRPLWKPRCGWSCMHSRHWTTASCISSTTSPRSPVSGSIRWMPS